MYKRNYEKETAWAKEKYTRIHIAIEKELGEKFKEKALKSGKSINQVVKEMIEEYLEE